MVQVEEAHKYGARDMQVVVCGNKCDTKNREVKKKMSRICLGVCVYACVRACVCVCLRARNRERVSKISDLSESTQVKVKEAQSWASKNGYMYYETSANSGDNVQVYKSIEI